MNCSSDLSFDQELDFGKHKDKTLRETLEQDKKYFRYLLDYKVINGHLTDESRYIVDNFLKNEEDCINRIQDNCSLSDKEWWYDLHMQTLPDACMMVLSEQKLIEKYLSLNIFYPKLWLRGCKDEIIKTVRIYCSENHLCWYCLETITDDQQNSHQLFHDSCWPKLK